MTFRSLFIMLIIPAIGPLIISLSRMGKDVFHYVVLLGVVMYGFFFAFNFIASGEEGYETSHDTMLTLVMSTVGGDIGYETMMGLDTERRWLGIIVAMLFVFFNATILVNLLIALMASAFDEVSEKSTELSLFTFVAAVAEYDDNNTRVPPPLNVLAYVIALPAKFLIRFSDCVRKAAPSGCARCDYCLTEFCVHQTRGEKCPTRLAKRFDSYLICPECDRLTMTENSIVLRPKDLKLDVEEYFSLAVQCVMLLPIMLLLSGEWVGKRMAEFFFSKGEGSKEEIKKILELAEQEAFKRKLMSPEERDDEFQADITDRATDISRRLADQKKDVIELRYGFTQIGREFGALRLDQNQTRQELGILKELILRLGSKK